MAITAAAVKELREMTGAGMMDCKKALTATDGDMDKAVEFLREKGLAAAAKKAGRIAAEGLVTAKVDGKKAVMVEVNSETDFVAKNAEFQEYVSAVADQIMNSGAATVEALLAEPWALDPTLTVEQELSEKIARIGEKLSIRRFAKIEANGAVVAYIHGGGRIGVLVEADTDKAEDPQVLEALKNVAMQIAALRPQFTTRADVPGDFIEKETEILRAQIMNDPKEAAKPEKVIEGMIKGRIAKELKEFCLTEQVYVKAEDGKQTVGQYLEQVSKAAGAALTLKNFVRFETGEGIEKRQDDFAAEVAKQMGM
ncbi:MAG: elongation factor Ts [Lachnospiraceae bacterium]|nr:elongation factor Ts [Clostridia bacterium]MBQ6076275.1 elongation factor Ts [Lachnospiraceae bacterium]